MTIHAYRDPVFIIIIRSLLMRVVRPRTIFIYLFFLTVSLLLCSSTVPVHDDTSETQSNPFYTLYIIYIYI